MLKRTSIVLAALLVVGCAGHDGWKLDGREERADLTSA